MFLSYILFELLDDEHGTPHITEKCKMYFSRPRVAIDPTFPQGGFHILKFPDTTLYTPRNEIC